MDATAYKHSEIIKIDIEKSTLTKDGLLIKFVACSHKRPYIGGATKATIHLEVSKDSVSHAINLFKRGVQGKSPNEDGLSNSERYPPVFWEDYKFKLKKLNYGKSVEIQVFKDDYTTSGKPSKWDYYIKDFFSKVTDIDFYQHRDFSLKVSALMSMSPEKTSIHLASPKFFDPNQQTILPVYISTKENSVDNKDFSVSSHGHIVLSSLFTGEVLLRRIEEKPDKEPLHNNNTPPPPPGYKPKVTTFYGYKYRDIFQEELPKQGQQWALNINSGKYNSNVIVVDFNLPEETKHSSMFYKKLIAESEGSSEAEVLNAMADNFSLEAQTYKLVKGEAFIVKGHFNLPDPKLPEFNAIPIHILITSKSFENIEVKTLFIANRSITKNSGRMRGVFTFDLMKVLDAKINEGHALADDIYISIVSRGAFSKPFRIVATTE